jgi:hypothetical protein
MNKVFAFAPCAHFRSCCCCDSLVFVFTAQFSGRHVQRLYLQPLKFPSTSILTATTISLLMQTPVHLAALRGNHDAVEYLVSDFQASTSIRDKNGCTPLMLAVKKEQLRTEWVIRRLTSKNTLDLVTNLGLSRLRNRT